MRIRVEDVVDAADGQMVFGCGGQSVKGHWLGPGDIPVAIEVSVELEISEEDVTAIYSVDELPPDPLRQAGDSVIVAARVERIGEDGIFELRVGPDIVLLETSESLTRFPVGSTLELRVSDLKVYPTGL